MNIELLSVQELENIISTEDEFQVNDTSLHYFSKYTENHELLQNLAEDHITPESMENTLYRLEELTKIPASYLHTDLIGPNIHLQTTTHQPITNKPTQRIGRFVTRLRHYDLPSKIDLGFHEEVRKAIINTKAFTHELHHNMDSDSPRIAQYNDGLLITDATKENFNNLSRFLKDYYTEVNSHEFRQQSKDTYRMIQIAKDTAFRQFLE